MQAFLDEVGIPQVFSLWVVQQEFQKFLKGKKNKNLTQAHLDRFQRILQMYVTPMKAVQVRFEKIKKRVEQVRNHPAWFRYS